MVDGGWWWMVTVLMMVMMVVVVMVMIALVLFNTQVPASHALSRTYCLKLLTRNTV